MQDKQLLVSDLSRMFYRLKERPVGQGISFDEYIKNNIIPHEGIESAIIPYEGVESFKEAIASKSIPFYHFYFRYLEKTDKEWALPLIKTNYDFGNRLASKNASKGTSYYPGKTESGYLIGLEQYFFNRIKIIEETKKKIILPFDCIGEMKLIGGQISNRQYTKKSGIRQAVRLIDTKYLILPKEEIKMDLIVGANFDLYLGGCFVTTACVSHKGLPDNCIELTVLRNLRNNVLLNSEEGKQLIKEYYATAPLIVEAVNQSPQSKELLDHTYNEIRKVVTLTLEDRFSEATDYYRKKITDLRNYCDLKKYQN